MTKRPKRALIYVRISKDREGQTSTTTQLAECVAYARAKGYELIHADDSTPYLDQGRSGYDKSAKRPGLDAAMDMARNGGVDVVLVWKLDRLTRQGAAEAIRLVSELDEHGVGFISVTQEEINTTGKFGMVVLALLGYLAEMESDIKSERLSAYAAYGAENGHVPPGTPAFGYARGDGTLVPVEDQVHLLLEAIGRIQDGGSLKGIVTEWNARGERTQDGKEWTTRGLRYAVMNPTIAGLRERDGETYPSDRWPALVSIEQWQEMVTVLGDPARRTSTTTRRQHLLAGVIECARCGTTMLSRNHSKANAAKGRGHVHRRYFCPTCTQSINADKVDEAVRDVVMSMVKPDVVERLRARNVPVEVELAKIDADEMALMDARAAGRFKTEEAYEDRLAIIDKRRAEAEAQAGEPIELPPLDVDVTDWEAMTVDQRRMMVAAMVETVTVAPSKKRGPVFDETRIGYAGWVDAA